jgi:hypothetical protein
MKKKSGFKRDATFEPDVKKRSARPAAVKAEKKMTSGMAKNVAAKDGSGSPGAKKVASGAKTLSKVAGKTAVFGQEVRPNVIKSVKKRAAQAKGK